MQKESKFVKYGALGFYIFILLFIVISGLLIFQEKESFYLDDSEISMPIESNYTIRFIGRTETKYYTDFIFTSSNNNVAEVDETGKIYAVGIGEAVINVKSKRSNYYKTLNVSVSEDNAYLIEFESDDIELKENETVTLKPLINNEKNYDVDLEWSSSDASVVSVDEKGKCIAIKNGVAYISVKIKYSGIYSRVRITVKSSNKTIVTDKSVTSNIKKEDKDEESNEDGLNIAVNDHVYVKNVELEASKTNLKVGETLELKYSIIPNNSTNKKVTFSSNNESVAIVDQNGVVTAKKVGNVDISIKTDEGKYTGFVSLTIENNNINVNSVSLNKTQTSLLVDGEENLTYIISPSDSTNQSVIWKSSNEKIVTVDNNGNIKGINPGSAVVSVTALDGNKTSSCNVTVKEKSILVSEIKLNKTNISLYVGELAKITATIIPTNATNQNVTFSSSNPSIAVVDQNGNIRALKAGSTEILVTSSNSNISAKCSVIIKEIALTNITLDISNFQISVGESKKINYSITPTNATDKSITWTSSNSNVATVDQNGNIKALSIGVSNIYATNKKSGVNKKVVVYVVPKDKLINIKDSKYHLFQHNIGTLENGSYKHMQNFAISNIGKDNQIIYLSTAQSGSYSTEKYPKLTDVQKANLTRTIVYKIAKSDISDPSKRNVMYLEGTGHGQAFELEPNSDIIWVNNEMNIVSSGGYYWGHSYGIMRIEFKEISKGGKFTPLLSTRMKDSANKEFYSPQPAIDKDNNLLLMQSGSNVIIYNYSEYIKGNSVQIFKIKLSSAVPSKYNDGTSVYNQGITLKGGYIYTFRGAPGKDAYIEAFNFLGESLFVKKLNDESNYKITKHREPEGIHIYNNKIYIGTTHYRSDTVKESLFDIGYYEGK